MVVIIGWVFFVGLVALVVYCYGVSRGRHHEMRRSLVRQGELRAALGCLLRDPRSPLARAAARVVINGPERKRR